MTLDLAVWEGLEAHGVTHEHLVMLLRVLQTQRNGSVAWHFAHGQLCTCDLRLTLPGRRADVARVSDAVLAG